MAITNDPKTWPIDWEKPIEWDDGTPAQAYGKPWHGQIYVLIDTKRLPQGFRTSAVRRVQVDTNTPRTWAAATNVIAAYGTPADGSCTCRIRNVSERLDREAMEALEGYGSF